jgi:hypothetical protein
LEEIFLHLLEWTRNKLAEKVEISSWESTLIKVENQTLVKEFKLKKKCYSLKEQNTERYKGKMKENSGRGHELSNGMFGIKSVHEDGMF